MQLSPNEMLELTELFVSVLRANPEAVLKALNKHLETADIELVLKRADIAKKYEKAWHPHQDFREGES